MKLEDIIEFAPLTRLNNSGELVDVVMKFKDGTVVKEAKTDRVPKYRTEVQKFLSGLPRATDALTCPKIKVLDKTWTLGHAYQTDEERARTSARGSGSGSSSDGSVKLSKKNWDLLCAVFEKIKDSDLDEALEVKDDLNTIIEESRPVDSKVTKAKALVDQMDAESRAAFLAALGIKA